MKTFVKVIEEKYEIQGKTTHCYLSCSLIPPSPLTSATISKIQRRFKYFNYNPDESPYFKFCVKASATCMKGDRYDASLGKHIANSKARAKMFNVAYRIWRIVKDSLYDEAAQYNYIKNKCWDANLSESLHADILGL